MFSFILSFGIDNLSNIILVKWSIIEKIFALFRTITVMTDTFKGIHSYTTLKLIIIINSILNYEKTPKGKILSMICPTTQFIPLKTKCSSKYIGII